MKHIYFFIQFMFWLGATSALLVIVVNGAFSFTKENAVLVMVWFLLTNSYIKDWNEYQEKKKSE